MKHPNALRMDGKPPALQKRYYVADGPRDAVVELIEL
jgi:hypothetical protein